MGEKLEMISMEEDGDGWDDDEIEDKVDEKEEEEDNENDQSLPAVDNESIDRNDTENNNSTQDEAPSPAPIETNLSTTTPSKQTTTPPKQEQTSPTNQSQSNKRPIDATPPHMVQKFMQQIQRITEHHKTEMSELEQKLKEKDELLRQYQQEQKQQQPL